MATSKQARLKPMGDAGRMAINDLSLLLSQVVAGSTDFPYQVMIRTLPRYVDDAERDFGSDLYDRMRHDAAISAAIETLKMRCVESGMEILPAIDKPSPSASDETPKDDPDFALAQMCQKFAQEAIDGLDELPIEDLIYDLLDGLVYGHRLAEVTFKHAASYETGRIGLVWDVIRPKPRNNYRLLVDQALKFQGILAIEPGRAISLPSGYIGKPEDYKNFLTFPKIALLTFASRNGDPRGTSLIRPAYTAWWMKQQIWPQYLKFLMQFAGPSLIGYTPDMAVSNDPAQPNKSPEEVLKGLLLAFQNGSVVALRGGSKVDLLQSQDTRCFIEALGLCDTQMTWAILKQTRATMEAENGSRADSETATDVLDVLILWIRGVVARAFRQQVFKPLISLNFGEQVARQFTPRLALAEVARPDLSEVASAIAALQAAEFWTPSQLPDICELLGVRQPSPEEMAVLRKVFTQKGETADPAEQQNALKATKRAGQIAA